MDINPNPLALITGSWPSLLMPRPRDHRPDTCGDTSGVTLCLSGSSSGVVTGRIDSGSGSGEARGCRGSGPGPIHSYDW